jgi:hypothetical protein
LERLVSSENQFQRKICAGLKEHDSMKVDSSMIPVLPAAFAPLAGLITAIVSG